MKFKVTNQANGEAIEFLLYQGIDEGLGTMLAHDIQTVNEMGEHSAINLRINSGGGLLMEGLSIHAAIKNSTIPVFTFIDGVAASAAALIAMSGKKVFISDFGQLMIHEAQGEQDQALDQFNQLIRELVSKRTGKEEEEVRQMLARETWLTAEESKSQGFVDEIFDMDLEVPKPEKTEAKAQKIASVYNKALAPKNGENLGNFLNRMIEEEATDERTSGDIVGEMAAEAGLDESTVRSILTGNIQCPPIERLDAFAEVLGTSQESIISAAEQDGCSYETNSEPMNKLKEKLGLDSKATPSEVEQSVANILDERNNLKKERDELKEEKEKNESAMAESEVDQAINAGKLDQGKRDELLKQAKADLESFRAFVASIPEPQGKKRSASADVKNNIGNGVTSDIDRKINGRGFRTLEKEDPKLLANLKSEDPDKYNELWNAEYNSQKS